MALFNDKSLKEFRRAQRNNASRGEQVLWSGLRKIGVGAKFRRQESIGHYIVDFYCPEVGLAVEVDGIQHEHSIPYDTARDSFIESIGVRVLRFKDSEVISNSEQVLGEIRKVVEELREKNGSYRRPTTQLHPDMKNRIEARRTGGTEPDQPPPNPRLGKAGE
jgi:very-short-patch-repair endonuclease